MWYDSVLSANEYILVPNIPYKLETLYQIDADRSNTMLTSDSLAVNNNENNFSPL